MPDTINLNIGPTWDLFDSYGMSWDSFDLLGTWDALDASSGFGIVTEEAFGTLKTISTNHPTGVASLEAFGTLKTISTDYPAAIASLEAFGTLKTISTDYPFGIESAEAFGNTQIYLVPLPPIVPAGRRMWEYLPPATYRRSEIIHAFMEAEGFEIDALRAILVGINGVTQQLISIYATWTLDRWEAELGMPNGGSLSIDERQARLRARWQGFGTITPDKVQAIASSFNTRIEVVEDFGEYTIRLLFMDLFGIPRFVEAMLDVLRVTLPSHLEILPIYKWVTWNIFDARDHTWDEYDALGYLWEDTQSTQI